MNRDFLQDIKIAGAMLVSRGRDMLHYSVPNLLKWCDWVLLMMDNEDNETRAIVNGYREMYPERIRVSKSGYPRANKKQEESSRGLFHRFKPLQGPIRETVFTYMHRTVASGEKIDVIVFPDSDEVFTDYMPTLLKKFWIVDGKIGVTMKPVDVYGDMKTLRGKSMAGHTRILKYSPGLTSLPYRTLCYYHPLDKQNRIRQNFVLVHLDMLTIEKRQWRADHWKPIPEGDEPLRNLNKDIREMMPDEIRQVLQKEPDMTVKGYKEEHNLSI